MRQEKYGFRDLAFSAWHRTLSDRATCIDLDFLEYCNLCKTPLALIETARDVDQSFKPTTILKNLAVLANLPAFLILFVKDERSAQLGNCRVANIHPKKTSLEARSLSQVAELIESIHSNCPCRVHSHLTHQPALVSVNPTI